MNRGLICLTCGRTLNMKHFYIHKFKTINKSIALTPKRLEKKFNLYSSCCKNMAYNIKYDEYVEKHINSNI